jgi:hypothetical protein
MDATSGFGTEIEAETLWEAAKRQGKKVITHRFRRRRWTR